MCQEEYLIIYAEEICFKRINRNEVDYLIIHLTIGRGGEGELR